MAQRRGFESIRSLMGLVRLLDKSSHRTLNHACAEASRRGLWRLRDVRGLLDSKETQTQLAFCEQHPLIRELNEYGLYIRNHCPP